VSVVPHRFVALISNDGKVSRILPASTSIDSLISPDIVTLSYASALYLTAEDELDAWRKATSHASNLKETK